MPKTKISEFSATPANNTDIDSINIAEGCAPSGINDAIRELMAQLKDFQTGAQGDSFNGPIGSTTPAAGVFTTLSASSTATLSGLTASTALALDASKNIVSVTNTGTGSNVLATSPTLVTPALGTPSALVGTNITGTAAGLTAGNVTTNANLTGAVTSVGNATSLGSFSSANLLGALTDETGTGSAVFATSPTLVTPILGTPTSATLTNATGLPIGTGVSGLGTGVATFLATPSSANLAAALTDETGTGSAVFATSPTLVTPLLGTPTSGVATNLTGLPLTTGVTGTLPTANGGTNLTSFTSGGVVYASSSSALATGSGLTFDGTNLGVGTASPAVKIHASISGSGELARFATTTDSIPFISIYSNGSLRTKLSGSSVEAFLFSESAIPLLLGTQGTERARITLDGNLLLGVSSDVLGGNKLLVQSAATANNNRTMSVYNSAATSTTPFANRVLHLNALGSGADVSISFTDNVAYNAYIGMAGANLNFAANNTTTPQMTLNSTGLGIGTSSPAARLSVIAATANSTAATIGGIEYGGSKRGLTVKTFQSVGGDDCGVEFNAANGLSGYGSFKFAADTTTLATLNANGVLALNGALTTANGVGITFPATQSASSNANTLDDYEEGTFAPTITFGGNAVGVTYNTSFNGATYTKIGNRVCISGFFILTNKGSSTGDASIGNLPFASEGGATKYAGAFVGGSQFTFANQVWARIAPTGTTIDLFETTEAGVQSTITNSDFTNGTEIYFSATYSV